MIRLRIENFDRLPDGGPLDYAVERRGFDFGRDSHLDWTLPDTTRVISGKHCEIRYYDDTYWLVDVSTNGTFVNGSSKRVKSPYQLNEGDKLQIGEYVISVTVDLPLKDAAFESAPAYQQGAPARRANLWDTPGAAPAPIDPRELVPEPAPGEIAPNFLHQALFVPAAIAQEPPAAPRAVPQNAWSADPPAPPIESVPPVVRPTPATAPAPTSVPAPSSAPPAAHAVGLSSSEFVQRFAKGAHLPEDALSKMEAGQLAELSGALLYITAGQLMSMLQARAEAKALSRSGSRTLIRAAENNPLKFVPTPEEALLAMLIPRGKGYLEAKETLEASFADLKAHHLALLAAMQAAASELLDEVSPLTLQKNSEKKKSLLGGGKSKQWDDLVKLWTDKSGRRENGMLDAFLDLFAESYDKFSKMKSS